MRRIAEAMTGATAHASTAKSAPAAHALLATAHAKARLLAAGGTMIGHRVAVMSVARAWVVRRAAAVNLIGRPGHRPLRFSPTGPISRE